jgi:hypothetical protein
VADGDNLENRADGPDSVAPHTEEQAIRELHESGTVVMPLILKDRVAAIWAEMVVLAEKPAAKNHPPGDAHKYAELSGGFAVAMRGRDVTERLAEVIDSLRGMYTIG